MEAPNDPSSSANGQPSDRRMAWKVKKRELKRRIAKDNKLIQIYKRLRKEITKLENREIPVSDGDYDEELEQAYNRRLHILSRKQLQIHDYFIRKGLIVSDSGEPIVPDEKRKLIITCTSVEDLNTLLTEYVNQQTDFETLDCKIRLSCRHVTKDDVTMLIGKVKETGSGKLFPDDSQEFDQFVQNIVCEVNKEVKQFIENTHKSGLADWAALGPADATENTPSTSLSAGDMEGKGNERIINVPTWDAARMEMYEACDRGELDCPEAKNPGDFDDTAMPATDEEAEDEEEEANAIDIINDAGNDKGDGAEEYESGDSDCCIVEERIHERCEEESTGSSNCCIIEDEDEENEMVSDNGETDDDENDKEIDLANNFDKEGKKGSVDTGPDKTANDASDDDCCVIED